MHGDINVCVCPNLRRQTQETPKHRISGTGRNIPLTGYIKRHLTAHLAPKFQSLWQLPSKLLHQENDGFHFLCIRPFCNLLEPRNRKDIIRKEHHLVVVRNLLGKQWKQKGYCSFSRAFLSSKKPALKNLSAKGLLTTCQPWPQPPSHPGCSHLQLPHWFNKSSSVLFLPPQRLFAVML